MKSKLFSIVLFLFITNFGNSQSNTLIVESFLRMPKDSVIGSKLIMNLNDFLVAAQKPNSENTLILPDQRVETYILLDEISGIEKSRKFKDDHYYKPYLTNIVKLNSEKYYLQISYIGVTENKPMLRASFELIAHLVGDSFLFSSPLIHNTKIWKSKSVGNNVFHYKNTINEDNIKLYAKKSKEFDEKLNSFDKKVEFYFCDNIVELLKIIGVENKLDYNGRTSSIFSSVDGNKKLIVFGNGNSSFDDLDIHDLWHDRLSLVISRRKVNKPIDEGCAYLYGGSWGYSWDEIFQKFKKKVASNKDADWIDYKENPVNFGENKRKHLMVDYVINALLIEKIEKEKGFSGVWDMLNCGVREKGNANYFKALEKVTGISKSNFNKEVWKLINGYKKQ